jgi:hypothetical protein
MKSHLKASGGSGSYHGGNRRLHRRAGALSVLLASLLMAACALPTPTLAVEFRSVVESFGPDGTSGTSFSSEAPSALTFDQGNHRLYVLDQIAHKIHGFDASTPGSHVPLGGSFPLTAESSGALDDLGADSSSHDLYYQTEGGHKLFGFDSSGAPLAGFPVEGFGDPCGAGVDNSGNIWVGDALAGAVKEYSPAGALIGSVPTGGEPCRVSFDSEDNLYVGFYIGATVKYTAASGYTSSTTIDPEFTTAMTVDKTTGEVFVIHYNYIQVWDTEGNFLYELKGEPFGGEFSGIAIDEATEELYVSDYHAGKILVYSPPVALPKLTTETADGISATGATVHGTINPKGLPVEDCHFEVVPASQFDSTQYANVTPAEEFPCVPAAGSIPVDTNDHAVTASLSGLTPATIYHFRLVATNEIGEAQGVDRNFTTAAGSPLIEAQSVGDVGVSDVIVSAKINPRGGETTYRVEYGPTAAYGQSTPESAPIGFPSDSSFHKVSVHIGGLNPAASYHFHFVATSPAGTAEAPDGTFTTHAAPPVFGSCPNPFRTGFGDRLPDCRAYEQVTPIDKHGANVQGSINSLQAASAGNRITFYLNGGLPSSGGSSRLTPFMASRGADGWSSDGLLTLTPPGYAGKVTGWSEDLRAALVSESRPGLSMASLYTRDSESATFAVGPTGRGLQEAFLAGYAADVSHLIFESLGPLLPGVGVSKSNLYDLDHGVLTLAGRVPPGAATSCDDVKGPACVIPADGSAAGGYLKGVGSMACSFGAFGGSACGGYTQSQNTISRDGSRVFFTAGSPPQVYVREDGTTTTRISTSQRGVPDPNGEKPATFLAATPDGSTVFFISCEKLTDDSTAFSTAESNCNTPSQGQDLYSYDVDSGALHDLTLDAGDAKGAAVQGLLGTSEDGSYVYFAANGVLAAGASPGSCAISGPEGGTACNIYVYHEGSVAFVAPANGLYYGDKRNWMPAFVSGNSNSKISRVSSDGRTLLFGSDLSQTGYPNGDKAEFYRYSAPSDELVCVTCNPSQVPPSGPAQLTTSRTFVYDPPRFAIQIRNLSEDGARVFFDSPDALLPTDTNGVNDVYEWEADGSGSCRTAEGCLYLLSTGNSPQPSYFADASSDGDHAFFFTDQQLVPGDHDALYDIYDAGVGAGLASQHALTPPTCGSTACQANPAPPGTPSLASSVVSGPGNVHKRRVRRCGKGKRAVRHAGRVHCQKKRHRKRHPGGRGGKRANDNRGGAK